MHIKNLNIVSHYLKALGSPLLYKPTNECKLINNLYNVNKSHNHMQFSLKD